MLLRTRNASGTYALYHWNEVAYTATSGRSEWSAEFHSGTHHRVETPLVRIVADCSSLSGFVYDVEKQVTTAEKAVGVAACGINLGRLPLELTYVRDQTTAYGRVDVIRLLDESDERFYAVDETGTLIASEYWSRDQRRPCLQATTSALLRTLPDGDIFSEKSLARSVVPEEYKKMPSELASPQLSGKICQNPSRP